MNAAEVYNFVRTSYAITGLIGGPTEAPDTVGGDEEEQPEARIYWVQKPQNELQPCIVLDIVSETPGQTLVGPDGYEDGLLTVTCFAPKLIGSRAIAAAVAAAFDGADPAQERSYTVESTERLPSDPDDGGDTPALYGMVVTIRVESA